MTRKLKIPYKSTSPSLDDLLFGDDISSLSSEKKNIFMHIIKHGYEKKSPGILLFL